MIDELWPEHRPFACFSDGNLFHGPELTDYERNCMRHLFMTWNIESEDLPDVHFAAGCFVGNRKTRNFLREFNLPGVDCIPIRIHLSQQDDFSDSHFLINASRRVACIDDERTETLRIQSRIDPTREHCRLKEPKEDGSNVFVRREAAKGLHLWRDSVYRCEVFCSEAFRNAFAKMGLTDIGFVPVRVV
jgi:hypothetical protein